MVTTGVSIQYKVPGAPGCCTEPVVWRRLDSAPSDFGDEARKCKVVLDRSNRSQLQVWPWDGARCAPLGNTVNHGGSLAC